MTHTFEIELENLSLQGEMSFNGSSNPQISTNVPVNLSLPKYKVVGDFLSKCCDLCKDYGEITKIEIVKKS